MIDMQCGPRASRNWLVADTRAADKLHFVNDDFAIGSFRADASTFRSSGPYRVCYLAFPRTRVRIVANGGPDFLSTPLQVNCYLSGAVFERAAVDGMPDHCDYLAFRSHWFEPQVRSARLEKLRIATIASHPALQLRLRTLVCQVAGGEHVARLSVEAEVHEIVADLLALLSGGQSDQAAGDLNENRQRARIAQVKEVLALRLHENVTLVELADTVNVSPFHLSREFRRHAGISLTKYLVNLRLFESLEWLRESGLSVAEIAVKLGFSHHSHFGSAFKRQFGCTPNAFRRIGLLPSSAACRQAGSASLR